MAASQQDRSASSDGPVRAADERRGRGPGPASAVVDDESAAAAARTRPHRGR